MTEETALGHLTLPCLGLRELTSSETGVLKESEKESGVSGQLKNKVKFESYPTAGIDLRGIVIWTARVLVSCKSGLILMRSTAVAGELACRVAELGADWVWDVCLCLCLQGTNSTP